MERIKKELSKALKFRIKLNSLDNFINPFNVGDFINHKIYSLEKLSAPNKDGFEYKTITTTVTAIVAEIHGEYCLVMYFVENDQIRTSILNSRSLNKI